MRGRRRRFALCLLLVAGMVWASTLYVASRRRAGRAPAAPAAAAFETPIDVAPAAAAVPFVLLFESGSGSSWLIKELAAHPQLCVVLFEPIDNVARTTAADHDLRLRWLDTLWTPPLRGAAANVWSTWRTRMESASVFGQLPLISSSLQTCSSATIAFGLKARLSRFLNHGPSVQGLRKLLAQRRVRVLRLGRTNRIKQALTEYRRHRAGLGHFNASASSAASAVHVDLAAFERSLVEVERSHRLAGRVLAQLAPGQPRLNLTYEELLHDHSAALSRVYHFLGVDPPPGAAADAYRKATPDRLCAAVANYGALCRAYAHAAAYAPHFDEPCDSRCGG